MPYGEGNSRHLGRIHLRSLFVFNPTCSFHSGFFGEPDAFPMFTNNNRVKRRPSPYEMEITDGESILIPHPG